MHDLIEHDLKKDSKRWKSYKIDSFCEDLTQTTLEK